MWLIHLMGYYSTTETNGSFIPYYNMMNGQNTKSVKEASHKLTCYKMLFKDAEQAKLCKQKIYELISGEYKCWEIEDDLTGAGILFDIMEMF